MRIVPLLMLVVPLTFALPGALQAQPTDSVPGTLVQAKQHFELGMRAFAAQDYARAVREFESALALAPSAELWFNLGRAYEELDAYAQARDAYQRYLRDSVDAVDADQVLQRIATLERLEAQRMRRRSADTGDLRVRSNTDGALVMVDGRLVGHVPIPSPLALQPGTYRLDVLKPGFIPLHAQVQVEPGMLTAAHADLSPLTRGSPSAPRRTWTWVGVGVTGAALATSAVLGALSVSQQRSREDRDASRLMDGANVALAGAALCALATTLVYFGEAAARGDGFVDSDDGT